MTVLGVSRLDKHSPVNQICYRGFFPEFCSLFAVIFRLSNSGNHFWPCKLEQLTHGFFPASHVFVHVFPDLTGR